MGGIFSDCSAVKEQEIGSSSGNDQNTRQRGARGITNTSSTRSKCPSPTKLTLLLRIGPVTNMNVDELEKLYGICSTISDEGTSNDEEEASDEEDCSESEQDGQTEDADSKLKEGDQDEAEAGEEDAPSMIMTDHEALGNAVYQTTDHSFNNDDDGDFF